MRIPRFAINTTNVDETKYLDYSNTAQIISNSGTVFLMNGCIQALDSLNDRIGRKILMKKITVRFWAGNTITNLTTSTGLVANMDIIRACVVFDKQSNGASANWPSLMNASGVANAPLSNRDISTLGRYVVLADTSFRICASGPNCEFREFVIPCSLETLFTTTNNGNITDIISGGLFFMIADTNTTANLPSLVGVTTRVEFLDA